MQFLSRARAHLHTLSHRIPYHKFSSRGHSLRSVRVRVFIIAGVQRQHHLLSISIKHARHIGGVSTVDYRMRNDYFFWFLLISSAPWLWTHFCFLWLIWLERVHHSISKCPYCATNSIALSLAANEHSVLVHTFGYTWRIRRSPEYHIIQN